MGKETDRQDACNASRGVAQDTLYYTRRCKLKTVIDTLPHTPNDAKTDTNVYALSDVNCTVWTKGKYCFS